jgi:L-ascorbate metabolism protein UlaG (beta-lactamase superfamily)
LRLGPFTLLTDPNFLHKGQFAWLGKGLVSRRRTEPALTPAELPPYDAVVLSHLHGDHFDRVAKRELGHAAPIVTTPHAARRLAPRGFRTIGLHTWERHQLSRDGHRLEICSLPAVHAFGALGRTLPPVMGSLVTLRLGDTRMLTVYLTGDTLLGDHLEAITERFPWIDTAVVHLGGTRVLGALVTLDGRGGVELLQRVTPAQAVPVHYDDYGVFRSPLSDFVAACGQAGLDRRTEVTLVERGDTVTIGPAAAPPQR